MAALRASAACAPHIPPFLLQSIRDAATEAMREALLAGNAHLLQAALAGLQLCGSDSLQIMVNSLQNGNGACAPADVAAHDTAAASTAAADNDVTAAAAAEGACVVSIDILPPLLSIISRALSPAVPLTLPLSQAPPPPLKDIHFPLSISAGKAAEIMEDAASAAVDALASTTAAAAAASRATNPAKSSIEAVNDKVPGISHAASYPSST